MDTEKGIRLLQDLDRVYLEAAELEMWSLVERLSDATYGLINAMHNHGIEMPSAPAGYERCAECGVPVPVGGQGLCHAHV